ncbi:MAG: signal peptide peptidase SppA [Rhodospirillales bacterium]|mgnify:CR=1 FL=1|jgi:protease IV|nr:signal peptide peptidase SppA [Rhodospirillales bacterium]MBT4040246.1 signal peptide peptidase SppA [Rhodospirillales bacterium]MBT4626549.1 signal peptide peptidase SppA [Rhodospirillales bacterium]MBT5352840.1 signal peptide peptidase SppA [Rhodospirillales bacterium]MBT5522329.1 signal peptide peptidase SppA [Rhodospirillales bacterium]
MAADIDRIIDRRRLKRSLNVWRVIGIFAAAASIALIVKGSGIAPDLVPEKPHIAVLDITDVILDDPDRNDLLRDILDDDDARALIVRINSPGGTFVGGENLYEGLRSVSAIKPVVAVIGNMGTSAAYMAALGSRHIFVREGSLTGSIGVILQSANIMKLLDKIGIEPVTVKSAAMKAQPNPVEEFTPESRLMIAGVIDDMYDIFLGIVAERRGMTKDAMRVHADGRVFTGRQALVAGLVDSIGGMTEAREWLDTEAEISKELPIINVTPGIEESPIFDLISGSLGKTLFSERLNLDGVLALWHPQLNM